MSKKAKGELKESDKLKERMSHNPTLTVLIEQYTQRNGGLTETQCKLLNDLLDKADKESK